MPDRVEGIEGAEGGVIDPDDCAVIEFAECGHAGGFGVHSRAVFFPCGVVSHIGGELGIVDEAVVPASVELGLGLEFGGIGGA